MVEHSESEATQSRHNGSSVCSTPPPSTAPLKSDRERRFSALLHRYFVNEIRPVRFGPLQDASTCALLTLLTTIAFHFAILTGAIIMGRRASVWDAFLASNQFLVGILMYIWMLGYDLVSWVIWWQFERDEVYPADDYYVTTGEREDGFNPVLLELPSDQLALGLPLQSA